MDIIDLDDILNRLENFKNKKPNKINTDILIDSLQKYKNDKKLINKTIIKSDNETSIDTNIKYPKHLHFLDKSQDSFNVINDQYYMLKNIVNKEKPKLLSTNNNIFLCFYGIININNIPVVLYISIKNNDKIDFINFITNNVDFNKKVNVKVNMIKKIFDTNLNYDGFINHDNNNYLFYQLSDIEPSMLNNENNYYLITISEIINIKKVYNYDINENIIDLFSINHQLCNIIKNGNKCDTPTIMYHKLFDNNSLNTLSVNIVTQGHERYSPNLYYYFVSSHKLNNTNNLLRCIIFLDNIYIINDASIIKDEEFEDIMNEYDSVLLTNNNEHIFIKFNKKYIEELDNSL